MRSGRPCGGPPAVGARRERGSCGSARIAAARHAAGSLAWAGACAIAAACTAGDVASPPRPGASWTLTSTALASTPIRRLRRLSSREYDAVVRDLLGDTSQPATRFVVDVFPNGYDNGSEGLAVQSDQVVDYQGAAEALAANAVRDRLPQLLGGCDVASRGEPACVDAFVATFAARAFRRPLTGAEAQRLRDVFTADAASGGFARGVQTMLEVVLQSPEFLYREELGPAGAATSSAGAPVRLTDFEVASELSFLLTGSMPDDTLWAAVQAGSFATDDDHLRQAARLLAGPGARQALRSFLHQWMTTDRLATIAKDTSVYPGFSPSLAISMASELDRFFDDVLWNGPGSLRALFTSDRSFVDPALAAVYGVALNPMPLPPGAPADAHPLPDPELAPVVSVPQPVSLDASIRPGILTRAGFLAVHADADSSGPIARGVFLLSSILCSPPPAPPAKVPSLAAATDPSVQGLTTRQRFAQHVTDPFCASCHARIDGVGFGFEEFDGIGGYRSVEDGQPIDSSGVVTGTGEIDGPFSGAAELATRIAGSRVLADCYARQAYRYAMGRVEDRAADIDWLAAASAPDARMTDVLLALVKSRLFVERAVE